MDLGFGRAVGFAVLIVLGQALAVAALLTLADHRSFWQGTGAVLLALAALGAFVGAFFMPFPPEDSDVASLHLTSPGGVVSFLLLLAPVILLVVTDEGGEIRVRAADDRATVVVTEVKCPPNRTRCPADLRIAGSATGPDPVWIRVTCDLEPPVRPGGTVEVRVDTNGRWDPVPAACGPRVPGWGWALTEAPAALQLLVLIGAGIRSR